MDQEHCFVGFVVEIDDDFFDQQAHDALFGPRIRCCGIADPWPDPWQIVGEPQQGFAVDPRPRLQLVAQARQPGLDDGDALQGPFQRASSSRATWRFAGSTCS